MTERGAPMPLTILSISGFPYPGQERANRDRGSQHAEYALIASPLYLPLCVQTVEMRSQRTGAAQRQHFQIDPLPTH